MRGSHVTVAGQRMNFGEADGGKALATVLTGFAQTFGAPSTPAADGDDPFARHRLTSGWNDPAAVTGARRVTGARAAARDVVPGGARPGRRVAVDELGPGRVGVALLGRGAGAGSHRRGGDRLDGHGL